MKTLRTKIEGRDITVTTEQLKTYQAFYVSNSELLSRISELFWFQCYVLDQEFGISPHDIIASVTNVEAGEPAYGIKPATRFNNLPLKGLWHKHYFSAHFLVNNMLLSLGKNGLKNLIDDAWNPAKSDVITQDMVNELSRRIATEPIEKRQRQEKLTGEWVIFAKHEQKNYYLSVKTHSAGDQAIYDEIMQHCVADFPELPAWIAAANTQA